MDELPASVCVAYALTDACIEPLGTGLINRTWLVTDTNGNQAVLQKVNSMFPPQLNRDIDVVTRHVLGKGLLTPVLIKTADGSVWVEDGDTSWRLYSFVDGDVFDQLKDSGQARNAGSLLAQFHLALADLDYEFVNARPGVHDTPAHLNRLTAALANYREHDHYEETAALAQDIYIAAEKLPILSGLPDRNVHGDPKISNLMFEKTSSKGLCMLDFDTLTRMPLPLEMGDAFRSWCNTSGEDTTDTRFSIDLFDAAVCGYANVARGWVEEIEWQAFVTATETIFVELAARFCADALNESYFAWDSDHFGSRYEHNIVRATGQLNAARSLAGQKSDAEKIVADALG